MGIRISQSTIFQLKLTIFDLLDQIAEEHLPKSIYGLKQKNRTFACR